MPVLRFKQKKNFLFPLLFLLIVGSFLRFYNLSHIFLWGDDPLHQVRIAYQPFWFVVVHNNQTALSTLLVHFLLALGKIEFMARLGSAICGILAIYLTYLIGKVMFSPQEGLMAAVFVTFSPFLIHFSQYSRAYAIFTALSLLSLYFFYKAIKENKSHTWIFYSLFTALGIYNHLMAFLIIPALASFVGVLWLRERLSQKIGQSRKTGKVPLARFILWTSLLLFLVVFLYIPNKDVHDFLAGSLKRAVVRPEDGSEPRLLIDMILRNQIAPLTPAFYYLTLFFLGIGVIGSLKKYTREVVLSVFYIFIPYFIFVLINPRTTNVLSADRFFIFILPVVLILVAKGIVVCSEFFYSLFQSRKLSKPLPNLLKMGLWVILFLTMVGGYVANFKIHYLFYWRFGSFKFDKEEMNFFRRHLKKDAVLHLDFFPVSSTLTIASPLTKNMKLEEAESIIRDDLDITKDENDFMVYQIDWPVFEVFVASRNTDLWMITNLDSESYGRLLSIIQTKSGLDVYPLKKHTFLHFANRDESIAQKMAWLSDIFLSLPLEKFRRKQFHWLAARASLMVNGIEEFSKEMQAAQGIQIEPEEIQTEKLPAIFRVFDKIFDLGPENLLNLYQEQIFKGTQSLLFLLGNNLLAKGETDSAARAYWECLKLGNDFYVEIAAKFHFLKANFLGIEQNPQTLSLFQKTLELDPERYDLRVFIAEAYRKAGDLAQAEAEYKKAFGMLNLPPDFFLLIERVPQSLIIWEKDSRWYLLFLSQEDSVFSGRVRGRKKISDLEKTNFAGEDLLLSSKDKFRFRLNVNQKQIKLISFKTSGDSGLNFDLKINGIRDPRKIIFLPSGTQPSKIPFDRDLPSLKRILP